MPNPLTHAIARTTAGQSLTSEEARAAFGMLMDGTAPEAEIEALLLGLRARGETAGEIAGAALALRAVMVRLPVEDDRLVDTAGTGGGVVGTFNISSAAALVAVGAGVRVAKHGNRSHTSRSGSAEVFQALGVPIDLAAGGSGPDAGARPDSFSSSRLSTTPPCVTWRRSGSGSASPR